MKKWSVSQVVIIGIFILLFTTYLSMIQVDLFFRTGKLSLIDAIKLIWGCSAILISYSIFKIFQIRSQRQFERELNFSSALDMNEIENIAPYIQHLERTDVSY